jgi:hypothetical protein
MLKWFHIGENQGSLIDYISWVKQLISWCKLWAVLVFLFGYVSQPVILGLLSQSL